MDITTLLSTYFVQTADANPPAEPVPSSYQDSSITLRVDCSEYNTALIEALNKVSGPSDFIYIANWWLGLLGGEWTGPPGYFGDHGPEVIHTSEYFLDGPNGTNDLPSLLKDLAKKGVDVRVLGWVSFGLMSSTIAQHSDAAYMAEINARTMKAIKDLRSEPTIGPKAILNVISHTAGAVHSKVVIVGNQNQAVGFTGGLDFSMDRFAHPEHPGKEFWHDVVAQVEGPAVQGLCDWFRAMWQENVTRPPRVFRFEGEDMASVMAGADDEAANTPTLDAIAIATSAVGKHHVQSVRTVPAFNYKWYTLLPRNTPASFAPTGLFEVSTAWRKAIQNAQTYVYIEDEYFWSRHVMEWINGAVKNNPNLRVILVAPGTSDPNDPAFNEAQYLNNSINEGLLAGWNLTEPAPTWVDQIRMFKAFGDTVHSQNVVLNDATDQGTTSKVETSYLVNKPWPQDRMADQYFWLRIGSDNYPVIGNDAVTNPGEPLVVTVQNLPGKKPQVLDAGELRQTLGITVHSKVTLIDDHWALIGSANCARRGLYTDWEHSVGIVDEDDVLVKEFRKRLWACAFRDPAPDDFDDIQAALHSWSSTWGAAGGAPPLPSRAAGDPGPPYLSPVSLPLLKAPFDAQSKHRYDMWDDTDSRDPWGTLCP